MQMVEQRTKAIKIVQEILENRMMERNRRVLAEHIVDSLRSYGWRGPKELRLLQEMVWEQAKMKSGGERNPYKEEQ